MYNILTVLDMKIFFLFFFGNNPVPCLETNITTLGRLKTSMNGGVAASLPTSSVHSQDGGGGPQW